MSLEAPSQYLVMRLLGSWQELAQKLCVHCIYHGYGLYSTSAPLLHDVCDIGTQRMRLTLHLRHAPTYAAERPQEVCACTCTNTTIFCGCDCAPFLVIRITARHGSPPVDDTDDWEDANAVAMAVCRSLADAAAVACKSITRSMLLYTYSLHF